MAVGALGRDDLEWHIVVGCSQAAVSSREILIESWRGVLTRSRSVVQEVACDNLPERRMSGILTVYGVTLAHIVG